MQTLGSLRGFVFNRLSVAIASSASRPMEARIDLASLIVICPFGSIEPFVIEHHSHTLFSLSTYRPNFFLSPESPPVISLVPDYTTRRDLTLTLLPLNLKLYDFTTLFYISALSTFILLRVRVFSKNICVTELIVNTLLLLVYYKGFFMVWSNSRNS